MEVFHVLNRGVDKRLTFIDEPDYLRFIQNLYIFNDSACAPHSETIRAHRQRADHKRTPLVIIHAFCLMPNHYHLLLSPVNDDIKNLSLFMKKINGGYAKYFNEQYERSGYLWQGKYKKIHIERDAHFQYIPYYIHLNALDLKYPKWRTGEVRDVRAALKYLETYRWSSYLDYSGTKNFASLISKDLLNNVLGTKKQSESTIKNIIQSSELAIQSNTFE